jgi:hypothetical protein
MLRAFDHLSFMIAPSVVRSEIACASQKRVQSSDVNSVQRGATVSTHSAAAVKLINNTYRQAANKAGHQRADSRFRVSILLKMFANDGRQDSQLFVDCVYFIVNAFDFSVTPSQQSKNQAAERKN